MGTSSRTFVAAALACVALLVTACAATGERAQPSARALATVQLQHLDGEPFRLASTLRSHRLTVLVWWATRCPCVRRYAARVEDLRRRYADRGVALIAVASNADDSAKTLKPHAASLGLGGPVVLDPGGRLAALFGVRTTPTTLVLDRRGRVRFFGWIDNERQPGRSGRVPYAAQAIDALLAGERPSCPRTPVYGCMITRRLGEITPCHQPASP